MWRKAITSFPTLLPSFLLSFLLFSFLLFYLRKTKEVMLFESPNFRKRKRAKHLVPIPRRLNSQEWLFGNPRSPSSHFTLLSGLGDLAIRSHKVDGMVREVRTFEPLANLERSTRCLREWGNHHDTQNFIIKISEPQI